MPNNRWLIKPDVDGVWTFHHVYDERRVGYFPLFGGAYKVPGENVLRSVLPDPDDGVSFASIRMIPDSQDIELTNLSRMPEPMVFDLTRAAWTSLNKYISSISEQTGSNQLRVDGFPSHIVEERFFDAENENVGNSRMRKGGATMKRSRKTKRKSSRRNRRL